MAASRINIVARSFSSSSAAQQMVKPPVQVFGVEGRYATALYSAAHKQKSLGAVETDLVKFQGLMKSDPKLTDLVKDPSIKRKVKAEAFKAISKSFNPATINLLSLLAENGRLDKLNSIINAFKLIMAADRGEVVCEVITAKPLEADLKGKLEAALKASVKSGQSIQLTAKVDPSIIGGMIVSIGDKYVDMSVASKIKKYTEVLTQAA